MDFREYMHEQIQEMDRHKWIESEKCGYDLGSQAHQEWLNRYAIEFRRTHDATYKNHQNC